ncbi:Formamidopyrimidine-DNA glycosylase N-terminal domain-containing protein [Limtongia smithiae]|uniref:Formamidopyrimidine-DNA glycosylase N-terminal domain-containing protein n=1 Tax=Limtongia smithiae TaxID=1125753 RepID=UPI0034CFC78C
MPELGEVAHAAKLLATHLKGKNISRFAPDLKDVIVFPQNAIKTTTAAESAKSPYFASSASTTPSSVAIQYVGKTIVDVGRHGKYFWMVLYGDSPSQSPKSLYSVILMHFGMTGWISIKSVATHFYPMERGPKKESAEEIAEVWPPRFTKFELSTQDGMEVAFTDPRRLGRVRFLEIESDKTIADGSDVLASDIEAQLKKIEPLCRSGPDFSKPDSRWDLATFSTVIRKRKVPVKSFLLDQACCAGIGNWMGDEILYLSRLHPEQYTQDLSNSDIEELYKNLCEVSELTVKTEGNTAEFPESWLMLHRWSKKQKSGDRPITAAGYTVDYVTVGGRTSCFVPALQKLKRSWQDDEPGQFDDNLTEGKRVKPKLSKTSAPKKSKRAETATNLSATPAPRRNTRSSK